MFLFWGWDNCHFRNSVKNIRNYNWTLNNMSLNYTGPLTHIFFFQLTCTQSFLSQVFCNHDGLNQPWIENSIFKTVENRNISIYKEYSVYKDLECWGQSNRVTENISLRKWYLSKDRKEVIMNLYILEKSILKGETAREKGRSQKCTWHV